MEESGADVSGADMSDCGGLDSAPLVLSPAQQQLQQQLRTKHAELARKAISTTTYTTYTFEMYIKFVHNLF